MRKLGYLLALLVVAVIAYLLAWPTRVEPVAWTPTAMPSLAEGPYATNDGLAAIERIAQGAGIGPEAIAVDAGGAVYTGYLDGRVMRFKADGSDPIEIANTGGRPLGLAFVPGGVVVADAKKGLLLIDGQGAIQVLSTEADGLKLGFTDDVDTDSTGRYAYFSDASWKFGFGHHMEDVIEHGANGRLLRYDFETKKTEVLMKDLHFANGIALGPDDAFVLVNETSEYRVTRYWLKGEKAGTHDVFVEGLPGFPDNVTFNGADRFWVAIFSPRDTLLDRMAGQPAVRKVVARLPEWSQPKPKRHAFALAFDTDGRLVANLQHDSPEAYAPITSVREAGEWLYFGSLVRDAIGRMAVAEAAGATP